jgi:hypothetical protein
MRYSAMEHADALIMATRKTHPHAPFVTRAVSCTDGMAYVVTLHSAAWFWFDKLTASPTFPCESRADAIAFCHTLALRGKSDFAGLLSEWVAIGRHAFKAHKAGKHYILSLDFNPVAQAFR